MNGDLTQQDLADLVKCSRQTIHSIESGKFVPSVELALRLARVLKVKVEDLFQLPSEESPEVSPPGPKPSLDRQTIAIARPLKTLTKPLAKPLTKPWKGGGGNV